MGTRPFRQAARSGPLQHGRHVGDVQALVEYLSLDRPAVAGYSFGSIIAGRLLALPWVSAAALSGTGSFHVEGESERLTP